MAASMNRVTLVGNVGADPETRSFQNGGKVVNLRLATAESWKDKQTGERKERTEWHTVAVFQDGLTGIVESYVRKGSKILVEGQLRTRKWQDQSGNDRYATEVVLQGPDARILLLDGRPQQGGSQREDRTYGSDTRTAAQAHQETRFAGELDDDVPF